MMIPSTITMRKKAALNSLSPEVIWIILESAVWTRRDLLSLCCVKFFTAIATRLFYAHFEGNVYRFLGTLARKPELARHVKRVTLNDPHQVRRLRILRQWEHLNQSVYHRSIQQLTIPDYIKDSWTTSLRKGDSGTVVGLLLAHLPNLECLSIREGPVVPLSVPFWTRSSPLYWFSGSDQEGLTFQHLKEVTLHTLPFPLEEFYFLFGMPSVRKLHVHNMIERRPSQLALPPRLSNISDLGIHAVTVPATRVAQIVSSCRKLVHLVINNVHERGTHHDLPDFFTALSMQKDSLERLELKKLSSRLWRSGAPYSFQHFVRLREIDCDAWVFDGAVPERPLSFFLPPMTRRIHIYYKHPRFLLQFGGMKAIQADLVRLEGTRRILANLKEIKLRYIAESRRDVVPYSSYERGVMFAVESMDGTCVNWGWG